MRLAAYDSGLKAAQGAAGKPEATNGDAALSSQESAAVMVARARAAAAAAAKRAAVRAAAAKTAAVKAAARKAAARAATAHKAADAKVAARKAAAAIPSGSPQQVAKAMLSQFGWSASQFSCLGPLWAHESGWNLSASNPSTGAYGIPQALPGSKMATAGSDWKTSAATQIKWGLQYIRSTYGSPCGAWSHEESVGWY